MSQIWNIFYKKKPSFSFKRCATYSELPSNIRNMYIIFSSISSALISSFFLNCIAVFLCMIHNAYIYGTIIRWALKKGGHVRSNLCYLICLGHLIDREQVQIGFFFLFICSFMCAQHVLSYHLI